MSNSLRISLRKGESYSDSESENENESESDSFNYNESETSETCSWIMKVHLFHTSTCPNGTTKCCAAFKSCKSINKGSGFVTKCYY